MIDSGITTGQVSESLICSLQLEDEVVSSDNQRQSILYYKCFDITNFTISSLSDICYSGITSILDSSKLSCVPVLCTSKCSTFFIGNREYDISCSLGAHCGCMGDIIFSFHDAREHDLYVKYNCDGETVTQSLSGVTHIGVVNIPGDSLNNCVYVGSYNNKDSNSFFYYDIHANIVGDAPSNYNMQLNENGEDFSHVYCLSRYVYTANSAVNIPSLNINIGEHITAVLREHGNTCTWEMVYRDNNIKSTMIDNGRVVVVLPEIYENGSTVRITRDRYFYGSEAVVTTDCQSVLIDNYTNSLLLKNERILVTSNGIDTGTDEIMLTSYMDGDIKGWTTVLGQNRWSYCTHCSCAIQPDFVVDMNTL